MSLLGSAILALAAAASGPVTLPQLERVGGEGGLLPDAVTALLQDGDGFVWIGSRDGLFRYDGFSFQIFRHDAADARSLPDDAIRTIFEDHAGSLWVGTNAGGLARLDRATRSFDRFRHGPKDPHSLSHDSVYALAEDDRGNLWVGTQRGLNRLDRRTGRFERFLADPAVPAALRDDYVSALLVDHAGRLWVGTVRGGLHVREGASDRFRGFHRDPADAKSLPSDAVFALAEDGSGRLWLGTDRGVARMSREGAFERVGPTAMPGPAPGPIVASLALAPGAVWVGTLGAGLWRIDSETDMVRTVRPGRPQAPGSAGEQVAAVLVDRAQAVWAGTWGVGLYRISPAAVFLQSAATAVLRPAGIAEEGATAVARARNGGAWVGTWSGALVRMGSDRATRVIRRFPGESIYAVAETSDAKLWIGTSAGLRRLDLAGGTSSLFHHDPSDESSIGPGYVTALCEDREGRLWVGTGEGGLQRIDPAGRIVQRIAAAARAVRQFRQDPSDAAKLSDDSVTAIVADLRGTIWIGTRSGGLNAFEPATGRVVRLRPEAGRTGTIGHHEVTSLVEDSRGLLWVGTAGGGFARVEPAGSDAPRLERFTAADGLVDDNVMAIVEDDERTLWISTKRGLSRFDPATRAFASYLMSDGLPSGEFERGAGARANGLVVFGSLRWVIGLPASSPFAAPPSSPTAIAAIRTADDERRGAHSGGLRSPVVIGHRDWLSVELAVLDFSPAGAHAYAYRLGEEAPWVELGSRREITFTGLAPAMYALRVRGRDGRGVWTQAAAPLAIRVVPPFWGTTWFRALVGLATLGAAIAGHRVRASALERRNRELVAIDVERERSRAELAGAYDRLGLLTRRLEAAKEEERGRVARELHDDLGPNLTAVIINLKLLSGHLDPKTAERRLSDSTELVDRMVQRIRDISLDLRPPLLEEMGLVAALRGYLEAQAERTGLSIDFLAGAPVPTLSPELSITAFRVTQEAVTNVIRHAAARRVRVVVEPAPARLLIAIEDDGTGFDVRATMAGASFGKALGLLGMQERVRLLGGEVRISSERGTGTRIQVSLPVEVAG